MIFKRRSAVRRSQVRRNRFLAEVERLEDRRVLDGSGANVFAQFPGVVPAVGANQQFNVSLTSTNFSLSGGSTILGFRASAASGSALDPATVQIRNTATNALVTPQFSYPDLANTNRTQSLALVNLTQGNYSVTVAGERSTAGAFQLDVFLPGDFDGNRTVTTTDGTAIYNRLGAVAGGANYKVEADANLDGRIDSFDYSQWRTNVNDRTFVNPLSLTVTGLSPDPVHLSNGSLLTNTTQHNVVGTVTAGAAVTLETGADNNFDEGSMTATAGSFSFSLLNKLVEGPNTVQVRARESFGQERNGALRVVLDTQPPVIAAALSHDTAPGGGTNSDRRTFDPAIEGQVTDVNTITGLKAGLDSTPVSGYVDILTSLAPDGTFTLSRSQLEAISGSSLSQGSHSVHFAASDQAGNTSSFFDIFFELDSVAPTATGPSGTYPTAPSFFDVTYTESMAAAPTSASAFAGGNYGLQVVGGPNDGQTIPLDIATLGASSVRVNPAQPLANENY